MKQIALLLCLVALDARASVDIIAPAELVHDADLTVRVSGLAPGSTAELRSEFVTRGGSIWRSVATFVADETGAIDPATNVPRSGSWQVADPHAFIWSMEKTKDTPSTTSNLENDDRSIITVSVVQDGKGVAEKRVTLLKRATGVSTTEIRDPFIGTFLQPYGKRSLPAVIVLGGSEGGLNRDVAGVLASHGYAALAVAYFGIDRLPDLLKDIPIETLDQAVTWLRAQPSIDPTRIAVFGGSKGAELALIGASRNPGISAVVAYAPASVVFPAITYGQGPDASSWTVGGKELPYAKYAESERYAKSRKLLDLYEATLAAAPASSVIPVEKIRGPVLLLAGTEDALWPSATMADQIETRAKEQHFGFPLTKLIAGSVGHHVASLPNRPTADSVRLGGTAKGIADAQRKNWVAIFSFLEGWAKKKR